VATWTEIGRLNHGGIVLSAAFVPGERLLATVSEDLVARQWVLPQAELVERACNVLTRNMTPLEWNRNFGREAYAKTCPNLPTPVDGKVERRRRR